MAKTDTQHAPDPLLTHHKPTLFTGLTSAQLNGAVKAGLLPAPVKIGVRLRGWRQSDLARLIQAPTQPTA